MAVSRDHPSNELQTMVLIWVQIYLPESLIRPKTLSNCGCLEGSSCGLRNQVWGVDSLQPNARVNDKMTQMFGKIRRREMRLVSAFVEICEERLVQDGTSHMLE